MESLTIGEMYNKVDAEYGKVEDMRQAIINHRTDTMINFIKAGCDKERMRRYMGYDWEDYQLCAPQVCDAGDGCCHKVKIGTITFCSPY